MRESQTQNAKKIFPTRTILVWCLALLAIATGVHAMQNKTSQSQAPTDESLIAQLKSTSLNKVDASLPAENFADWFAAHRKGSDIRYEIESCDDTDSRTPYAGKGTLKCVTAVSVLGGSELVLRFVAAAPGKDGKFQAVDCSFLSGSEGPPPESRIKRMTRAIFKLSDLHWD